MTTTDPVVVPASLSTAMRQGSQLEHEQAESAAFTTALLGGRIGHEGYAAYLARLRTIYLVLEDVGAAHRTLPAVRAVHDPALDRLSALDADLAFWAPGGAVVDSPAATAYADRIRASVDPGTSGVRYLAHHYTRYLGDLSGGQAIGRVLTRQFELTGDGVAFYAFPRVPKPKLYKDAYRARLDALELTAAEREEVVDEVRLAFTCNQRLFEELAPYAG